MKKLICLLLSVVFILTAAGCGAKTPIIESAERPDNATAATTEETTTEQDTTEESTTEEPTTAAITAESLKSRVREFTNKKIVEFVCDDFDGDGVKEAFALTGKVEDSNLTADLIFAAADKCERAAKNIGGWYSEDTKALTTETINGRKFLFVNFDIGAHGELFGVFSVFNGACRQLTVYDTEADYGMEFGHVGKEDDRAIWVNLQSYTGFTTGNDTDGIGLTSQTYYFYWDEAKQTFREYGAIEVSQDELAKVKGAETALELIKKGRYKISSILFRGNGVTEINVYQPEEENGRSNSYLTLKYKPATNSFDVIRMDDPDISDPCFFGGICLKAITDKADYPNAFLAVKDWYKS